MADGSREAPTTATARGRKNGRNEAAVATRSRISQRATLAVVRHAAQEIGERPYRELVREPNLSVVGFRRLGWEPADYQAWTDRRLADECGCVVPTTFRGETLTRFAVVYPHTTQKDVTAILDTMA